MIPYGKQSINQADIDAVVRVLQSDWLTQGPVIPRFEEAMVKVTHAAHAVAVNSATSALHLACLALNLGPNDWLWTSPNTFVASANCALYCGANVDFVDIDPRTYNLCVDALRLKLEAAELAGKLPKIVIPVHFAGQSCDMVALHQLSQRYGFKIIEDASHAVGSFYRDKPVGCCEYSDIAVFSFHPVKIMTTGEGGVAVTNNPRIAKDMAKLRTHGITRDTQDMVYGSGDAWHYEQHTLGYNYRMTDMQAALGLSQLDRLAQFVKRRQFLAACYDESLGKLPLILPYQHLDTHSSFHLYVIQIDPSKTSVDRKTIFDKLRALDINVNVHYIPVHLQPYYKEKGFYKGQFPIAERYYEYAITLPLFFELQEEQQGYVVEALTQLLKNEKI